MCSGFGVPTWQCVKVYSMTGYSPRYDTDDPMRLTLGNSTINLIMARHNYPPDGLDARKVWTRFYFLSASNRRLKLRCREDVYGFLLYV